MLVGYFINFFIFLNFMFFILEKKETTRCGTLLGDGLTEFYSSGKNRYNRPLVLQLNMVSLAVL